IMTGELPYEGAGADYIIIRKIFESPLPQVNGESRLSDCLQVWELMIRCWAVDPLQRPTSAMCKTTVEYLPHCPPTPKTANPQPRSAALLENLGDLESWKGNHKAGFVYLEQALCLYEQEGNDKGIASVLRKQAAVAYRDSNHLQIMNAASAALQKSRSLQDDIGVADALFWIGSSFLMQDKRMDALPRLQESLEILRTKGNSVGLAKCLERLGELHRREGQAEKALLILEEAVDIASRCGDRLGEASALTILGVTQWNLDQLDQAISSFQRARDIAKNIGWEHGLTTSLCRLGGLKLEQGILGEAEEILSESVRIARNSQAGWRLAQALLHLGRCFQAQGRHEEAISALEESCSAYQSLALDFEPAFGYAAALLAETKSDHGHKEGALVSYDRAIAEYHKCGDKREVSKCLAGKAVILVHMDRCDEGALYIEASLAIDLELRDKSGVQWNQRKLSGIPKTVIKWEVGRQARLALAKLQPCRSTPSYDVKKLQRRVPQLATPILKSP
ncbi:hypothetical protein FRC01_000143, partial [Tulasnella sp. 417]